MLSQWSVCKTCQMVGLFVGKIGQRKFELYNPPPPCPTHTQNSNSLTICMVHSVYYIPFFFHEFLKCEHIYRIICNISYNNDSYVLNLCLPCQNSRQLSEIFDMNGTCVQPCLVSLKPLNQLSIVYVEKRREGENLSLKRKRFWKEQ